MPNGASCHGNSTWRTQDSSSFRLFFSNSNFLVCWRNYFYQVLHKMCLVHNTMCYFPSFFVALYPLDYVGSRMHLIYPPVPRSHVAHNSLGKIHLIATVDGKQICQFVNMSLRQLHSHSHEG